MCGIAGTIGLPRSVTERALAEMQRALTHRGPDDRGLAFVADGSSRAADEAPRHDVGLVHTRLSIIDVSPAGHQPMESASGRSTIVFNGEIYNFRELRRELAARGARFRTGTDTEVILEAYEAWGTDAITRMHGMFAFGLVDRARGSIWLSRDRLGQKPIYLATLARGGFAFASEMRALLASGLVPRRADPAAISSFLAQGMVCGTSAIAAGVTLLAPATSMTLDFTGRELSRQRYWTVPRSDGARTSYADARKQLGATLRDSIAEHLLADVPLGLFLSGGVDSAAVATIATEVSTSKLRTVTVGFDDPSADESADAEAVARELGTEHRTVRIGGQEMLDHIDDVFESMDQPTVDGFNSFFVSRAARRAGLTVALSGVGGDELFGGYATFRDVPRALRLARVASRAGFAAPALAQAARLVGGRRGVKLAETLSRRPDTVGAYLLRRELFLAAEREDLGSSPASGDGATGLPSPVLDELRDMVDGDRMSTVSRLELGHYMRDMLLRDADAFSMAAPIELRVPLLDDRIVTEASRLPGKWKRMRSHPKALLIDAAGPRLPRSVVERPKRGFTFPWDTWLRGPLRERARGALEDGEAWHGAGLRPDSVRRMWAKFAAGNPRVGALQVVALWVLAESVRRTGLSVQG